MNPYQRIRKTIKWGGAVVTVLLAAAWISCIWTCVTWRHASRPALGVWAIWHGGVVQMGNDSGGVAGAAGWRCYVFPALLNWKPEFGYSVGYWEFVLPLWIPVAISLTLTATAWRLDALARRRARVGFCPKCNYDRSGLAAGTVCPECGALPVSR